LKERLLIPQDNQIKSKEHLRELWTEIYNTEGKPDWSHIIPYYNENIHFQDTVQEINGIQEFKEMTERLVERSENLQMNVKNVLQENNVMFLEWEMTLSFKKRPNSTIYGASRVTLNDVNQIIDQRDYYDLWGDIFDNIPKFGKMYRKFMKKKFG
jgi:hypothetical protein